MNTSWVDRGPWNSARGNELVRLVAAKYYFREDIVAVATDVGIDIRTVPLEGSALTIWKGILQDAIETGLLRPLLDAIGQQADALAPRIEQLSEDDPPSAGNPIDPYDVRLAGPGSIPIIDRVNLRSELRGFVEEARLERMRAVLTIRGIPQSGKSHSFELIKYIVGGRDDVRLIHIDFSPELYDGTATELMTALRTRLEMRPADDVPPMSTSLRMARRLVDDFVSDFGGLERRRRMICIDSLNRADLEPSAGELIDFLTTQAVNLQLPLAQWVLIGYEGTVTPASRTVRMSMRTDETRPILRKDVEGYFAGLASDLGQELPVRELREIVDSTMRGDPELEMLSERVRDRAITLMDTP